MNLRSYITAILMIICNIYGGIITAVSTKAWLVNSGLGYITKTPFLVSLVPVFFFSITLFMLFAYMLTKKYVIYLVNLLLSVVIASIEAHYAFYWTLNTNTFFLNLYPSFELLINTPQIVPLQNSLSCCGFRTVREFKDDTCDSSATHTCYVEMCKRLSLNLSGGGVFLIAHFISHLFVCILFRKIHIADRKSRGYGQLHQGYGSEDVPLKEN